MSYRPLILVAIALLAGCSGTVVAIVPTPSPSASPTPKPSADTILVDRHASNFGGQRSFTLTIPRTGPVSFKFEGGKEGTLTPSDKLVAQLFAALDGPQPSPPQVDCALARADYTTVTYGSLVISDATGCANRWPGTFYADLQELEAQLPT